MQDPKTMSYNAGFKMNLKGYNRLTGTTNKTYEEMINWYNNWIGKEPDKYFAYIHDENEIEPIVQIIFINLSYTTINKSWLNFIKLTNKL